MSGNQQAQFNTLNEITKVAAIKAITGLSKMLGFPIGVDVVPVTTKSFAELKKQMQPKEKIVGLNLPVVGELPGTCLMISPEISAFAICNHLFRRKEGETKSFTELEKSALSEVANIITGNFLTSFALSLQLESLMHRAAHFNSGEFSTFMQEVQQDLPKKEKTDNLIEMAFKFQSSTIQGEVIFLFDAKKVSHLLEKVSA